MARNKSFFRKSSRECAVSSSHPSHKKNCFQRRSCGNSGFSLVEVVLAMGIIAVAFIPLMGLLPMGLTTSRQAIDTTIEAQIIQQMTGQAQETNWSTLTGLNASSMLYFDANGNTLPASSASSAIYKAGFSVPTSTSNTALPAGTALPGGTTTPNLTTITIYILSTRTPGGMAAASLSDLQSNSASVKYTLLVPNNGL
jgi:uncharacterized protein (TIGR02598 family)